MNLIQVNFSIAAVMPLKVMLLWKVKTFQKL